MEIIIEITFESVQLVKLVEWLTKIKSESILSNFQTSLSIEEELFFKPHIESFNLLNNLPDGSFYFNFSNFNFNGIALSNVGIQVYKFKNEYDINSHFNEKEIRQKYSIDLIHNWARIISEDLKARDYYCGYEPSYDKTTQFFSQKFIGPLKW